METVVLNATPRSTYGKFAANNQRKEGLVPCVMYSKDENISFNASPAELRSLLYTQVFKTVDIHLNGKVHKCILKEVQTHPVSDSIIHLDFLKLVKGTSVKVHVPINLTGSAVGVKSGGKLVQRIRTVLIKAASENIVPEVKLDVSKLDLGQTMRIKDILPIQGVEILIPASTPVVGVEIPRALKSEADATAKTADKIESAAKTAAPAAKAAAPAAKAPAAKAPAKK